MLTMIGGVSEFFSDQLGVHVVKGLRERAESGLPAGPVPFGYKHTDAATPALVIPVEAGAVQSVYVRRVRGDSNGEIAAWLNDEGFQPHGRNALFTPWAVRDMLRTRFYVGVVTFQGQEFPGQPRIVVTAGRSLRDRPGRCLQGLAEVAERRGDIETARTHLDAAGELFAKYEAKLYLDQVLAKKQVLRA